MQTLSSSRPAAAISYESYGNSQQSQYVGNSNLVTKDKPSTIYHYSTTSTKKPASIPNGYYDPVVNLDNELSSDEQDSNSLQNSGQSTEKVKHSTPSYSSDFNLNRVSYFPVKSTTTGPITQHEMYLPPKVGASQTFSSELPTLLNNYGSYSDNDIKFSTPHPTTDFTSAGISHITQTLLNDRTQIYGQNHLTNTNSVSIEQNGEEISNYGPTSPSSAHLPTSEKSNDEETTTPRIVKITYSKPQFKPKPTNIPVKDTTNKYVLVHTISNEKEPISQKPDATISSNNYDSIQSIILMLNGSQSGPEYETNDEKVESPSTTYYSSATPSYGSSPSLNDYGSTSFYITTKLPSSDSKRPSTSYIFSSTTPSRRPSQPNKSSTPKPSTTNDDDKYTLLSSTMSSIQIPSSSLLPPSGSTKRPAIIISSSTYGGISKPNTNTPPNEVIITPTTQKPTKKATKRPSTKLTTLKAPSTSYVTASPTRLKYPSKTTTTGQPPSTNYIFSTQSPPRRPLPTKSSTTSSPFSTSQNTQYDDSDNSHDSGYVQLSTISDRPHPTVHITPKPSVGVVQTTNSWTNGPISQFTVSGQPSITSLLYNPVPLSSRPGYYSTTPVYPPLTNDFDDSGYFGSSVRPTIEHHSVTSTAIYNIVPQEVLNSYGNPVIPSTYPISSSIYGDYSTLTSPYPPANDNIIPGVNDNLKDSFDGSDPVNNFPPVRNPNLNTTMQNNGATPVTPQFQEDDVLKQKMSLLVNKIVDSLQGNFESLADMVYDRNETYIDIQELDTTQPIKKPTTTGYIGTNAPTKRPATKKPTIQSDATLVSQKPTSVSTGTKPVTTKKPRVTTTKTPTKKPVTKKPSTAAITTTTAPLTTRKSTKATRKPSTKPTKRVTTTTTTITTLEDEYEDGGEGEEEIGQESENDVDSTGPPGGRWRE